MQPVPLVMNGSLLIADSGSTKTDWMLVSPHDGILEMRTMGINPVRDSQDAILRVLREELLPQLAGHSKGSDNSEFSVNSARSTALVSAIHFFGAGCIEPFSRSVTEALQTAFPTAKVHVDSDLLGAAIALCGHEAGIACILGTGSNSCLYDGRAIVKNVSPLGFILGDEGSGAVLGRTLLGNLFKGGFPQEMRREFLAEFGLTQADVIDRVYRQPQPNRFLASLVPFIEPRRRHPLMHAMLVDAFRQFFQRNIRHYERPDMPVHFVGSIASIYESELREAARMEGYQVGRILQRPAHEIANFYKSSLG